MRNFSQSDILTNSYLGLGNKIRQGFGSKKRSLIAFFP
jgi:hypothetical protein